MRQAILKVNPPFRKTTGFAREALNAALAVGAISALYVGALYLILHRHGSATVCFATTVIMAFILYFTWFKYLPSDDFPVGDQNAPGSSDQQASLSVTNAT